MVITIPSKKKQFTLQKYEYHGWHSEGHGKIMYVDLKHKHPDPLNKLLWGYDKNGEVFPGDYKGLFTKVGRAQKFEYTVEGRTAAEERASEIAAIRKAIKRGW